MRATLIVLVTLVCYWPVTRAGWVYEDHNWIGTLGAHQVFGIPDQWPGRYLTQWSYQVQANAGDAEPRRYHVINVCLHLLTGFAVYALGRALQLSHRASLWSAAVFLWHPLNVAAVAYVSARSDVLMTLCAVLAVSLPLAHRWWAVLFVVPACLLSGASKELGAVSVLLVIWTWYPTWLPRMLSSLGLIALAVNWREYGVLWPSLSGWWEQASANVMSVWRILTLMVLPVGLNMDPDPWFWRMPERVVGVLVLLSVLVWVWRAGSDLMRWTLGWLVLSLGVRIVMPIGEPIHDQHAYLAMVGTALLVGSAIGERRWPVACGWRFSNAVM